MIDAVAAGESFVVTRNGVPIAELTPIRTSRRTAVPVAELAAVAASGPAVNRNRFTDDLDRAVDQRL